MPILQNLIVLSNTTPVILDTDTTVSRPSGEKMTIWHNDTLFIQNVDVSANVYLGTSAVTNLAYGIKLPPGASATIDNLGPTEVLYAISDINLSKLAMLSVQA